MSVENVENHMAHTCKCGSVNFALLKSGAIECNKCSDVMSEAKWLSAQPVEEHSLSLSYQIRRAIKAEDALRTAKQEVANLNELLNASYVDPTGKSGLSALLKKVFWPSKLDKEILELVASQAIELEELGKEVTCIPDMREEIVYLKAQLAAAKQAQPERAPSVPEGWKVVPVVPTVEMIEAAVDHFFAEARPQYRVKAHRIYADMIAAAPAIKQGGQ